LKLTKIYSNSISEYSSLYFKLKSPIRFSFVKNFDSIFPQGQVSLREPIKLKGAYVPLFKKINKMFKKLILINSTCYKIKQDKNQWKNE
jgi:hypothetical protein